MVRQIDSPLVSIVVTTYNSGHFVLETLNSVRDQTYAEIELIVSDDGSSDDTIEKSEKWLADNQSRFVRTELIVVPGNTGVSANCNRGIAASRADWIKFIAGDDILFPSCIEDNVKFILECTEAKVVFSQIRIYREQFTEDRFVRLVPQAFPNNIMANHFSALDQHKRLLGCDRINFTPSYFFNKQAILSVGGYEETNRLVEDYPMWLRLTGAGFRLFFFERPTVGYRQHDAAINNRTAFALVSPSEFKSFAFRKNHVHQLLPWDIAWKERHRMAVARAFSWAGLNKQTPFAVVCFKLLTVYLNPFQYIGYVKRKWAVVDPVFYGLS